MAITLTDARGTLKRFRRTPWRYQQTFHTPLKNLRPFVAGIISCLQPVQAGCITIDAVIFEPTNLNALIAKHAIPVGSMNDVRYHDWSLTAGGQEDIEELLRVVLGGWIDFIFVPTPKRFAIYADHDEYTTFFSVMKSHLNRVVRTLDEQGFRKVNDYQRHL